MKHGSLFSGIGGFDLAAEWMGWENIFHCEWNPFGQKVLKYYWPQAKSYHDITKTNFTIHRGEIDILTGGFPCQPYSMAGKRKGKDDERHLWPEMLRAIREIRPRWIVGENVFGLVNWNGGMVFNEVQTDLEAEGYEVFPYVLPAAAVNAPHRRDRVWFVAKNTMCSGCSHREFKQERTEIRQFGDTRTGSSDGVYLSEGAASDTNGSRNNTTETTKGSIWEHENKEQQRDRGAMQVDRFGNEWDASNTDGAGWEKQHTSKKSNKQDINSRATLHPNGTGEQGEYIGQAREGKFDRSNCGNGINNFQNFPTQSPVCIGDDGLPSELDGITFPKWRNESIKAGGNAIVPQVVLQIFKAIEQYEKTIN